MTNPESEFTLKDGVLGHSTHLEKLPMTTWMTPKNLNRRDFFKLGAAACAGSVLPSGNAEAYPEVRRRLCEGDALCGIDIGSDQVRTVLARVPESSSEAEGTPQLEVLAVGQAESRYSVQYGEVMRLGRVTEAIREAVEEVEQAAGVEVGSAFVSVGSRTRRSVNSSGTTSIREPRRRIGESDVYRAVMAAVPRDGGTAWLRPPYELLHALPQEFRVDDLGPTEDPTGWTGEKIGSHVHLVSCPSGTLRRLEEAVNGAGIRVERLVAAPLAAGYGVLHPEDRQEGVVVLDIGSLTTEIAVFRRGALWHSDLMPTGGRAYTRDLAVGLKTSYGHAEHAKRRCGVTPAENGLDDDFIELPVAGGGHPKPWRRRLLADVLRRRAESDLTNIRDRLRQVLRDLPGTVVLTGGGANLDGLRDVARLVFGGNVEIRGPRGLTGKPDPASPPHFATAVGLCRYGGFAARGASRNAVNLNDGG
ncbi:MAG: cell division protein FtsA [Gammaproteobacteria bacterium]|nr:cell division protein FtsA [Gammaproteobacteria bacterium]